jgi:hypothetical protein
MYIFIPKFPSQVPDRLSRVMIKKIKNKNKGEKFKLLQRLLKPGPNKREEKSLNDMTETWPTPHVIYVYISIN